MPNFDCSVFQFDPTFELKNNGTSVLTAATINYSYNGTAQTAISWTGSLAQNEIAEIELATFNPTAGTNTIEISVVTTGDGNANNNSSNSSFSGESNAVNGADEINIYILPDDYGSEIEWQLTNPMGTVVASGGPYTNNNSDPINETYVVPYSNQGCYEFTIIDDAGDGICCGYGIGNYELTDINGTVLAEGAEYDSVESTLMAMSAPVSVDEKLFSDQIAVFPNPANDFLIIDVNQTLGKYQFNVVNIVGQTVVSEENANGQTRLDVENLTSGVYFIEVKTSEGTITEKIVVR